MVSTVLANVSMSSLNQAGTQHKMSTEVSRPLFFKIVVRGLNLSEMKNHFHSWWLANNQNIFPVALRNHRVINVQTCAEDSRSCRQIAVCKQS